MIVAVDLPKALASAVSLEAARTGQSPAGWLLDRLHDRFGLRAPASAASVPLLDDEDGDAADMPDDRT